MEQQNTIKSKLTLSGKGLHFGKDVTISILPADANTGINFCRVDLENKPIIPALVENVTDTSRGTTLDKNGAKVATLEHLMAALHFFKIDNALIEIDGDEIPILDGSSKLWVEAIKEVGVQPQLAKRYYFSVKEPITYIDQTKDIELTVLPYDGFKVDITIDYNSSVLEKQSFSIDSLENFDKEIANCRTFVFLHEIEQLLKLNLIKGGDLDNALVFVEEDLNKEQIEHLAKVFNKDPHTVKAERGILNHINKKFENEPVRHKLLDFIGDIKLLGIGVKGHFILKRPGHHANTEFAKLIKKVIMEKMIGAPKYDPNQEPVLNINDIKTILPHRFPMLLVDKIIEAGEGYVVGVKNVTSNEDFFNGHFPSEPVMPGVLIVEAMAQTGGILVLKDYEDTENYNTYFLKIDGVRFRGKVVPGDTLIFRLFLTEPVRRGLVKMKGEAYVGSKLVMEAELMAQIAKNK